MSKSNIYKPVRTGLAIMVIILSCISLKAQVNQPGYIGLPFSKYISSTDYKSGMLNSSITQDGRGFMYFANNFGLLEFDGNSWRTYPVRDGSKVRSVAISREGRIYIGAQGDFGYFFPDGYGELQYHSMTGDLPEESKNFDDVWKVFIGKETIYFCTLTGIYIFNNDSLVNVISIEASTNFFFLNGKIYYQEQEGGGLFSLEDNKHTEEVITSSKMMGRVIVAILPLPENKFYMLSSENGIFDHLGERYEIPADMSGRVENLTINCALRLRNGNIAMGTSGDGIYIFNETGEQYLHMTKAKGLENRSIYTLFEDSQNNLWLGHNNGVSMVELGIPFSYLNEDSGLPGSGYDAYRSGNQLFVATNNGVFQMSITDPEHKFSRIINSEGQSYSVEEERGRLLIGHHRGSFQINEDRATLLNNGTGTWTYLQAPDDPESLVAGTYLGLQSYRMTDAGWAFHSDIEGFEESSRVMEYDSRGNLWMTHGYKGVYRLRLNNRKDSVTQVSYFGMESGLPSNALNNVFWIDNKLVFTTIDGPYIFDYENERFKSDPVLSEFEVMKQPLNYMASDAAYNIYFLTRDEIGVLKKQVNGSYIEETDIFNKISPMLNDDLTGISIISSSNILYGAKEGFVIYNPLLDNKRADRAYRTFIRNVSVSGPSDSTLFSGNFTDSTGIVNKQGAGSRPELTYNYNSIRIRYSASFINDFDQTQYSHMLEGFDDGWSEWHSLAETVYTNLPKGEYTFRVKARNIYHSESQATSYSFTVLAPWYASKIAYIIYLIIFLSFMLLIFREIDKRYRKSKRDFELVKQSEVDEISGKLDSLSQEKKQEIERLQSEKLQSEIEHKNAQLASSTMNLINKNIFITQIKSNLSSVSKKSKSDDVKKELSRIRNEIDRNISYDQDWDQFTFHFNSVHGDFIKRLTKDYKNLSAQDLRLCSYLRLNLSTKEIAHLLNISVRGVEISRYRLRKKLNLDRSDNLAEFILNY